MQAEEAAGVALEHFAAGRFDAASQVVREIARDRPKDVKVAHNLALADFVRSKFTQPISFLRALETIRASHANLSPDSFDDNIESSVLSYNHAVVLVHLRQFESAIAILARQFKYIQAVEETLARKICFLLLDLYINKKEVGHAATILTYLENIAPPSEPLSAPAATAAAAAPTASPSSPAAGADSSASQSHDLPPHVRFQFSILLYKAKLHLLSHSIKNCQREIKSALNIDSQNVAGLVFKARFEVLRSNPRKAIKILSSCYQHHRQRVENSSKEVAAGPDRLTILYFNNLGCVHHAMGKHSMAALYFARALQENEAFATASFVSTSAAPVLHLTSSSSSSSLSKASSKANSKAAASTPGSASSAARRPTTSRDVTKFAQDRRYELLYSYGVQLLLTEQYEAAYNSLQEALTALHKSPRLWLRLAECCIGHHLQQQHSRPPKDAAPPAVPVLFPAAASSSDASTDTKGEKPVSGYLVDLSALASLRHSSTDTAHNPVAAQQPLSLHNAMVCLQNALVLLPHHLDDNPDAPPAPPLDLDKASQAQIVAEKQRQSRLALKYNALLKLAYVALELQDPATALLHAENLEQSSQAPANLRFLATLYSVEACVMLGRVHDALARIGQATLQLDERIPPAAAQAVAVQSFSFEPTKQVMQDPLLSPDLARGALQVQLAASQCVANQLEAAARSLPQVAAPEFSKTWTLLQMYLKLRQGDSEGAIRLARSQGAVRNG
ncbi:hypothetical protein CAOG_02847 [Capsaspora owczarzaki ATCC 30864]|uniref:hypothetical protein n=1 Tax=Capsaspora owczarzaki (strain ATCC 30864) TaxID=595528 RepID=UPI0001FE6951|nr:hypothetical protein CAOG_02847 [Capsaspora owczarzaki ATCC 30864]|eukprot:XP_004348660.1 hypothetical protein CAOG_02847 [Capsaspora owczarzaki ATCC 30864]